jgi:UDP-glucose 4-epimerase
MVFAARKAIPKSGSTEILNIANDDWVTVKRIAELVVLATGLRGVGLEYSGGSRGWAGDVPRVMLDGSKLAKLGWVPKNNSEQCISQSAKLVWNGRGLYAGRAK